VGSFSEQGLNTILVLLRQELH